MSDTPRTDLAEVQFIFSYHGLVYFARTLERELTAAQATIAERDKRIAELEKELIHWKSLAAAMRSDCDQPKRELAEARAEIARLREHELTVQYFGSWLDHWSIQSDKSSHRVYGAWDDVREKAKQDSQKGGDTPCPPEKIDRVCHAAPESNPSVAAMVCEHGTFHPAFPCIHCAESKLTADRDRLQAQNEELQVQLNERREAMADQGRVNLNLREENEQLQKQVAAKDEALRRCSGFMRVSPKMRELIKSALSPDIARQFVRREVLDDIATSLKGVIDSYDAEDWPHKTIDPARSALTRAEDELAK